MSDKVNRPAMTFAITEAEMKALKEWQEKIIELMESLELRKESVEKGQQYIRDRHSKEILLNAWDELFESVL